MILSCVIVDDEPLALSMLENYVYKTPYLLLAEKFSSAARSAAWLKENPVDLVFMDIQMPDMNGLEVAKMMEQYSTNGNMRVIFTTAYSKYALEGYKVQPIDYLLKPYNYNDFTAAAKKALQYFSLIRSEGTNVPQVNNIPEKEYIYLRVRYEVVRVAVDDIAYLEGAKDYVKVFLAGEIQPLMTYATLKSLVEKLPPAQFMKVHRSFIVAKSKIRSVTKNSVTIGDALIPVSENYREEFLSFIENWQ
jgi:DNA-binding LytR/AlgR family response regulator